MKQRILLVGIIIAAFVLRVWSIGVVPPSPDWDEVSLGYNAYSLFKTGKDEFGQSFPIILRSFDDYKPPLYAYLAIPTVALMGLTVEAVRVPSILFGTLAVLVMYFLIRQLLRDKMDEKEKKDKKTEYVALTTAGLLAISPWHIQFSRVAFESSTSLTFLMVGLLFFLYGLKKTRYMIGSALFFALTFYTYQSAKVFTPLFLVVVALVYYDRLLRIWKKLLIPAGVFIALVVPFVWSTFTTPNALLRARGVSVFADQTEFLKPVISRLENDYKENNYVGLFFDNRRIAYAKAAIAGYLSHFDLKWLFLTGDQPRHQAPGMGHMYLWQLPFFLYGIYVFVFSNISKRVKLFILLWILITPVPASITRDVPHPIRTIQFLPPFMLMVSLGIIGTLGWIRGLNKKYFYWLVLVVIVGMGSFSFIRYLDLYFVQYPYVSGVDWQYGYEEAVPFVESIKDNYKKVVVTNKPPLDQSYMFFLFYTRYDPKKYLLDGGTESGGFAEVNTFDNYTFRPIDWNSEEKTDVLFIGRPSDFPESISPLQTIYYPDRKPAITIVGT